MAIDGRMREMLASRCTDKLRRITGRNLDVHHNWEPQNVLKPWNSMRFTEDEAWEFIADNLREGTKVDIINLRNFPFPGLVMIVSGVVNERRIYMKIAHTKHNDGVLGISFHYSNEEYRK